MDGEDPSSIQLQLRAHPSSSPSSPHRVTSAPPAPTSHSLPASPARHASMGASVSSPEPADANNSALEGARPSVITNDVFLLESDHGSQHGVFEGAPFWDDGASSDVALPRPFYAPPKHKGLFSGHKGAAIVLLLSVVLFLVGLITGLALKPRCEKKVSVVTIDRVHGYSAKLSRAMQAQVNPSEMESELKFFSRAVHQAGSEANRNLSEKLFAAWSHFDFDDLFFDNYTVQLSYADAKLPNTVVVRSHTGAVLVNATSASESVDGYFPYNAFSPSGTIEGEFVFVNFGSTKDLAVLAKLGVSLKGRVAVARVGGGFRGGVAHRVAAQGARALVTYPDPADFAPNASAVFPHGWFLPGDAPVFGNVRGAGGGGDPRTPGLPAVDGVLRTNHSSIKFSPIPVQPIGYDDARAILALLGGPAVPAAWRKSLAKFVGPSENRTLAVVSHNRLVERRVRNVVAVVRGDVEPDRLVLLGNHIDAWLFGASDPLSGTVVVHQVAKLFARELGRAYRPQRTLVFVAWDGEEMGTVGSTEFVERVAARLAAQAVAYVNLDCPIKGAYSFFARSSPLLRNVTLQAAAAVPMPGRANESVLDDWTRKLPGEPGRPELPLLGGGSDQGAFLFKLGIPSVYPQYIYNGFYPSMPAYHTKYDSFKMMDDIIDPGFVHHGLVARVVIDLLLRLADCTILPLSVKEYPRVMLQFVKKLQADADKYPPLRSKEIDLQVLVAAIDEMDNATTKFVAALETLKSSEVLAARRANDALMQVSRAFLWPEGLPSRPYYKNILLSPSLANSYGGSFLTGLMDGLHLGLGDGDWEPARRHFSVLVTAVRGAALLLGGRLA